MNHFGDIRKIAPILGIACCFFVGVFAMPIAQAQSIPITKSVDMYKVVFDGKWTFYEEWKPTSLDYMGESGDIYIRSAHQENFIYILLDVVLDTTIDKNQDFAMICFDTKNDQSAKPDANDYCFKAPLGSDKSFTFQGSEESDELEIIENHVDLIAVGATSDENDRYSKVPHASYEFRIPVELLERTDSYGFYIEVYDNSKTKTYTWPSAIKSENSDTPSPATWGIIYSPDKSLPEYDVPILVLVIGIFSIILLSIKSRGYNLLKIPS